MSRDDLSQRAFAGLLKFQIALALLTNPYGSSNFGLNIEYQYQWVEGAGSDGASNQIALEGLVVIP